MEVLGQPPAAALPSNLTDFWLDAALQSVEEVVNANATTDPAILRLPLTLVLHILAATQPGTDTEMSDEQLFWCLKRFRFELAMEKLRRWGVKLREAATEATIFREDSFDSTQLAALQACARN